MDYKNRCRTCLGAEKEMRSIHSSVTIAGEDVHFTQILQDFYNYKVTPDAMYPDSICINCVHHLTMTYSFKILIESSSNTLLNNLNILESTCENNDCEIESEYQKPNRNVKSRKRKIKKKIMVDFENRLLFCVECKAEFCSKISLNEHCTTHHPAKSEIGRECPFCNEKFEDFRSLALHRKMHLKPYVCENCWEGYYTEEDLNLHMCQPNKEKAKPSTALCQCDQCGKSYPPGYIKIHMLTHSNERGYSCKYCPKKFKVPGGLNSHVLWNHKRTRNHKCEVCNATFISSSSRSSHVRKHHLKEKKYGCDTCSKRFFSKSELQRHCLTHTGVKNFHCHLCDKSYQTRYGLNVHLKSHLQMNVNVLDL